MTARKPEGKRNRRLLSSRVSLGTCFASHTFQGGSLRSASEPPAGNNWRMRSVRTLGQIRLPISPFPLGIVVVSGWAVFSRAAEMPSKPGAVDLPFPSSCTWSIPWWHPCMICPLQVFPCCSPPPWITTWAAFSCCLQPNYPTPGVTVLLRGTESSCTSERAG